jgi:hypothetical protein
MTEQLHDYDALLLDAYKGELFGNALFAEMAGRDEWREHLPAALAPAAIEERTAGHNDVSRAVLTRYLETAP